MSQSSYCESFAISMTLKASVVGWKCQMKASDTTLTRTRKTDGSRLLLGKPFGTSNGRCSHIRSLMIKQINRMTCTCVTCESQPKQKQLNAEKHGGDHVCLATLRQTGYFCYTAYWQETWLKLLLATINTWCQNPPRLKVNQQYGEFRGERLSEPRTPPPQYAINN